MLPLHGLSNLESRSPPDTAGSRRNHDRVIFNHLLKSVRNEQHLQGEKDKAEMIETADEPGRVNLELSH